MGNEKGSTLIQVLLVILIFSVLGISLLGNVVGENKRVVKTDAHVQERNLVRDGLTYFEADFRSTVEGKSVIKFSEFLEKYSPNNSDGGKKVQFGEEKLLISAKLIDLKLKENDKTNGEYVDFFKMEVVSKVIEPFETEPLTGYYSIDFDIDFEKAQQQLASFQPGAKELDLSNSVLRLNLADLTGLSLLGIQDLGLLSGTQVDLLKIPGNDDDFYPIPDDQVVDGILNVNVGHSFHTVENNEAIAVRNGVLASVNLANIATINVLELPPEKVTNVVIDGQYSNLLEIPLLGDTVNSLVNGIVGGVVEVVGGLVGELLKGLGNLLDGLLGGLWCTLNPSACEKKKLEEEQMVVSKITTEVNNLLQDNLQALAPTGNPYDNIYFEKLAVLGDAIIEQNLMDSDNERTFTFDNGLYVGKILNIGGFINDPQLSKGHYSKLLLDGDFDGDRNGGMYTAAGLNINNAEIDLNSDVYAYNTKATPNSTIKNACIDQSDNRYFRMLTNGKLAIHSNSECSTLEGFFFSKQHPVTIYADEDMTIEGGVLGKVNVVGNGEVTIKFIDEYLDTLEISNAKLIPLGRTYD